VGRWDAFEILYRWYVSCALALFDNENPTGS
jgi:hypothetical protein